MARSTYSVFLATLLAVVAFGQQPESRPASKEPLRGMDRVRAVRAMKPEVGKLAPDFDLMRADGKGRVKLSDYRGSKPVLLVFGSWT